MLNDNQFLLAEIAKLYYIDKVKQKEIAERFQLTPMLVSRLLKRAEDENIVQFYIKTPSQMNLELGKKVKEKYHLSECIALKMDEGMSSRLQLGKFLADYMGGMMSDGNVIGISWGKTILEFVRSLPYFNYPQTKIIQLSGGFTYDLDDMSTPSNIIRIANERINGRPLFINAPFFIETEEAKMQLLKDKNNQMLLELAKQSNFNIIGASPLDKESTTAKVGVLQQDDIQELAEKGAVGDLAGFLIDKEGNQVEWSKSKLYMGVPLEEISKAQNVICLADGRQKYEVLKAALNKNYFNILITSETMANLLINGPE